MHDAVVIVGVEVSNVVEHRLLVGGRLRVLFAQIPVERQIVSVAGDHFPAIELALLAECAPVE